MWRAICGEFDEGKRRGVCLSLDWGMDTGAMDKEL